MTILASSTVQRHYGAASTPKPLYGKKTQEGEREEMTVGVRVDLSLEAHGCDKYLLISTLDSYCLFVQTPQASIHVAPTVFPFNFLHSLEGVPGQAN